MRVLSCEAAGKKRLAMRVTSHTCRAVQDHGDTCLLMDIRTVDTEMYCWLMALVKGFFDVGNMQRLRDDF